MTLDNMKYKQEEKQSKPITLIMLLTPKGMANEAKFPYINIEECAMESNTHNEDPLDLSTHS